MTIEELDEIEEHIRELGIIQSIMVLSRETAERITKSKDLTPLMEFCRKHHIALKLNRNAPPGVIFRTDED